MKEFFYGLLGAGLPVIFEDDLKKFRYTVPRKIRKMYHKARSGGYGWEDYTILSLVISVLSLAYILIKYS